MPQNEMNPTKNIPLSFLADFESTIQMNNQKFKGLKRIFKGYMNDILHFLNEPYKFSMQEYNPQDATVWLKENHIIFEGIIHLNATSFKKYFVISPKS